MIDTLGDLLVGTCRQAICLKNICLEREREKGILFES